MEYNFFIEGGLRCTKILVDKYLKIYVKSGYTSSVRLGLEGRETLDIGIDDPEKCRKFMAYLHRKGVLGVMQYYK